MKSAQDWDRTGLAGGPVTSLSRLAAPRLHNRARRAPPPTFGLRFPEGPLVCAGGSAGSSQTHCVAPAREGVPPRDQLRVGIFLLPTCKHPLGSRPRAASSWLRTRAPSDRLRSPSVLLRGPSRAPARSGVQGAGGRAGLPARLGGVWAPGAPGGEGRASRPPGHPPGLRRAFSPRARVSSRGLVSAVAGRLGCCPAAATGVGGGAEGRALSGLAAGERLVPRALPPLFRQLSLQSEVADTQETLLKAQSLLPTAREPTLRRQTSPGPSRTKPGVRRFRAARSAPPGTPWLCSVPLHRDQIPCTCRNLLLQDGPSLQRRRGWEGEGERVSLSSYSSHFISILIFLIKQMLINRRHLVTSTCEFLKGPCKN